MFEGGVGEEGIEGGGEVGGEVGGEGGVAVAGSQEGGDMMGERSRNLAGRGTVSGECTAYINQHLPLSVLVNLLYYNDP